MQADAYRMWGAYKRIMPSCVDMVVALDVFVRCGLAMADFTRIATIMQTPEQMMKHKFPGDPVAEMSKMAHHCLERGKTIAAMLARRKENETAAPPEKFRETFDELRVQFPLPRYAKPEGGRDARK